MTDTRPRTPPVPSGGPDAGAPPTADASSPLQRPGLWLGLALSAAVLIGFEPVPGRPEIGRMAAVAVLMGAWWITEAIPLAATALLPIALFPLLGILPSGRTAAAYANPIIFLYIGGFLIALAMERWDLHRRLALSVIARFGRRADLMVLGFMLASAGLSMWISNTATAAMMLPIGIAVIRRMEETFGRERARAAAAALMLGIAYGCSIGGVATLVGTPTNLAFASIYARTFPDAPEITFGRWFIYAVPISVVLLGVAWIVLTRVAQKVDPGLTLDPAVVRGELAALGRLRYEERAVLLVFVSTAVLWMTRADIELGAVRLSGWSSLTPALAAVDDSTVAVTMALLLFLIPTGGAARTGRTRLLEAGAFRDLPWPIVVLFGGGFALADGFTASGLSAVIVEASTGPGDLPVWVTLAMLCFGVTFLTELTSNVATITTLLPLVAAWAVAQGTEPLWLMAPATVSASMAFMMPVATPPNAIVFGSDRLTVLQMARAGIGLNLAALVVIVLVSRVLLPVAFPWVGPP